MGNDFNLDFQGHLFWYSSSIFKGYKYAIFEHKDFSTVSRYFQMWISLSSTFNINLENSMF